MPNAATKKIAWARKDSLAIICALALLCVGITVPASPQLVTVHFASGTVSAKVAITAEQQAKGLSGVASLAPDAGMLFAFKASGEHSFWMKDMRINLDIVWFNADRQVIKIDKNVSPASYPQKLSAGSATRYVLEVASGEADRLGIAEGAVAQFAVQ